MIDALENDSSNSTVFNDPKYTVRGIRMNKLNRPKERPQAPFSDHRCGGVLLRQPARILRGGH